MSDPFEFGFLATLGAALAALLCFAVYKCGRLLYLLLPWKGIVSVGAVLIACIVGGAIGSAVISGGVDWVRVLSYSGGIGLAMIVWRSSRSAPR
jgi:hypothetical protein